MVTPQMMYCASAHSAVEDNQVARLGCRTMGKD